MSILSKINVLSERANLTCPVCHFLPRDAVDFKSIKTKGACTECYNNFRYTASEQWEEGIMPTVSEARSKMAIKAHI